MSEIEWVDVPATDAGGTVFVVTMDFPWSFVSWYRPTYRGIVPQDFEKRQARWWRRRRGRAIRKMRREGNWPPQP